MDVLDRLLPTPADLVLCTDLYQLTMLRSYFEHGMAQRRAVFDLFVRKLPPRRGFLVVAGLEPALAALESLRFEPRHIDVLRGLPAFEGAPAAFWDYLLQWRFRGLVRAIPEGRAAGANTPLLQVEGALGECQLVETLLLSLVNYSTLVATKAARCVEAARGRPVFEFGLRRAHGPGAGNLAARAAAIAGFAGTSNVHGGVGVGMPVVGTVAHSFVEAFGSETRAFEAFAASWRGRVTLLVDTYDVERATRRALRAAGERLGAIRIDSGDLAAQARAARAILDAAGRQDVKILLSGDLDEYRIDALVRSGAPVDLLAVGTRLVAPPDGPALGGVYKLVAVEDEQGALRDTVKLSPGKPLYPGRKQVWRVRDASGAVTHDELHGLEAPPPRGAEPLLEVVFDGARGGTQPGVDLSVQGAAQRWRAERATLPAGCLAIDDPVPLRVDIGADLVERREACRRRIEEQEA